jgi:hypothetical protein
MHQPVLPEESTTPRNGDLVTITLSRTTFGLFELNNERQCLSRQNEIEPARINYCETIDQRQSSPLFAILEPSASGKLFRSNSFTLPSDDFLWAWRPDSHGRL